MGAVYECSDLRLNRTVAIKIMLRRLFGNDAAMRRFDREARAIASLRHPNIVEIYDFGSIGNDGAYIVMPRLRGRSWRSELELRGSLSPALAADWLDQVLSALEAAHASGVVHCDLKPENLHVGHRERGGALITILDFGLARMDPAQPSPATVTLERLIGGTPGYVSPEQLEGLKSTEVSDIFALGVLAVESLTGRRPFDGVAYMKPPRWGALSDTRYVAVRRVLERCLAVAPQDRIPTATALRSELIAALRACASA
jgi:serine/threonine-protein kinase